MSTTDNDGGTLGYESREPAAPPRQLKCVKCGGQMLLGAICRSSGGAIKYGRPVWIEGEIKRGFLGSLRFPKGRGFEVVTYRCPACGYLEDYSPPG
jgi:predicted nucleic-acid-binding Zn-ribbon protein